MKPLYLLRATPRHGEKNYSPKRSLTLEFSAPLLGFTCTAGIQLYRFEDVRAGIRDSLPLSFRLRNSGRRIHLRAAEGTLRMGEVYLLRITPALRRADGKPFDQTVPDAPPNPYVRFGDDKFYQAVFTTAAPKDLALALDDGFPKPKSTLVDLNVAESAHLAKLPGMTRARAAALVSRRSSLGQFADFTDVMEVRGIGETTLRSVAQQSTVSGVSEVGAAVHVTRGKFVEIVDARRAQVQARCTLKGDIQSGTWATGADRAWYLTSTSRQTFVESVQLGSPKVLDSWPVPAASDIVMASGRPSVFLRGASANQEERLIRVGTIQGIITSWRVPLQPLKPARGSRATSGTRPLCLSQDESQVWMIGAQAQVSKLVAFDLQQGSVVRNIRLDSSLRVSSIFPSAIEGNAWLLAHGSGSVPTSHLIEFDVAGRVEVRRIALPQQTSAAVVMLQQAQAVVASGQRLMKVALEGDHTPKLLARLTGPIVSLRMDVQTGFIYALTQFHGTRRLHCLRPGALIADAILSDIAIGEVLPVGLNVVYPARQRNFLTVFNPNASRTNVTIQLRHEGGGYASFNPHSFSVAPGSRDTILLDDHLIAHGGFSCQIDADGPIVAERSSYWNRATHQIGVAAPALPAQPRWYFAEGFRHPTFRNALELFNPGNARATVTLHLLRDRDVAGLSSWPLKIELAGRERRRLDVDHYLPDEEFGFGLRLEATSPITAERSMYWLRGAQASTGVAAPATQAYFAGGSTMEGATTFVLLAAPAAQASVQLFLRDEAGVVITPGQNPLTVEVGAGKRNTVRIDETLVGRKRFSVEVRSSAPVVAEISVYLPDEDGYSVPGEAAGRKEWYFSEGWTGGDFQPVLCIFNPSTRTAQVTVSAPGVNGVEEANGGAGVPHIRLPAFGSAVVNLREHIPPEKAFSIRVKSNSGVVVHREMRWGSNQAIDALAVPLMPNSHIALTGGSYVPPPGQDRRLDLNQSTRAQLEMLPAVGAVRAQAIIDYRRQHGRFKNELDLLNVPGFGGPTFEAIHGLIKVERLNTLTGVDMEPPPRNLGVETPETRIGSGFIESLEAGEAFEEFSGLPQTDILSRITEDIHPHTGNLTVRQIDVKLPGRAQLAFELARLYDPMVLFQGQIVPRVNAELHRRMIAVRAALDDVYQEGTQEIASARNELAVAIAEATQEAHSIAEQTYNEAISEALQEAKDEIKEQISSARDDAESELDEELAELESDLADLLDDEPVLGDDDDDIDGDPQELYEEAHAEWEQEVQDTEDELLAKQDELEELKGEEPPEGQDDHDTWQDDVDQLEGEIADLEVELQDLEENEPELEDFLEGDDEDNEEFEEAHDEWEEAVAELEDAIDEVEQALADLDSEMNLELILNEFEQEFLQQAEESRDEVINKALEEFQREMDKEVAIVTAEIETAETTLQQNYNRARRLIESILSSNPGARRPLPLPLGLGWMFDLPAYHIEQQLLHAGGGALIPVKWVDDQFAPPGFNLTLRRVERQVPGADGSTKTARYELEKEQFWYLDDLGLPLALTDRARVNWVTFDWVRTANQDPQLKLVRGSAGDQVTLFYTGARLERMAWSNNREVRFSYEQETEFWRLTQVADSLNRIVSYRYDESLEVKSNTWQLKAGLLSLVKFPGKGSYGYQYDSRPPAEPIYLPLVVASGGNRIQDEELQYNGPPYVASQYHLDNAGRTAIEVSYTYNQAQKETHETIISEPGRLTRISFRAALDEEQEPVRWDIAEIKVWPAQDGIPAAGPPAQLRKMTTDALGNVTLVQEERQGVPCLLTSIAYEGEQARYGRPARITHKTPGGETLREILYAYHPVYKDQLTSVEGDVSPKLHWSFDEDGRDPVQTGQPTSQTVYLQGQPLATRFRYDEFGNLVEIVGPDGRTVRQAYGERNGVVAAVLTEYREGVNQIRAWRFEPHPATGWLMGIVQPDGKRVSYERDTFGRIKAITDPLGRRVAYEYKDDLAQVVLKKPDGCSLIMEDDGLGRVLNRKLYAAPSGIGGSELVRAISYSYDPWGNISARTDVDGAVTTWQRDWSGRPLSITYPDQSTLRWQYDDRLMPRQLGDRTVLASMVREIDQENANRDALFDALGQEIGQIVPLDNLMPVAVTALEYNRAGQLVRMRAPRGGIEQYVYDDLGRMVERLDAVGAVERSTYYPGGQLQSLTNADGATTSWELDEWGRPIAETDPTGNRSSYVLDAMDRIIEALDPTGARWLIARDAAGAVERITDPLGGQTNYQYDVAGRLLKMTDALGATTQYVYDRFGDLLEERDALNRTTRYERALNGRVTAKVDRAGGRWTMEYDLMGRMTAAVNPLGQRTGYLLNKRGEVNAINFYDGQRATFKRDQVGRIVKREGPGKLRFERVYDSEGNVLKEFDADGVTWNYEYDLSGRVLKTIDGGGHATEFNWSAGGRLLSVTGPGNAIWRNAYDAAGRIVSSINPVGVEVKIEYDAAGRQVAASLDGATARWSYDSRGMLTTEEDPTGRKRFFEYDAAGRMKAAWKRAGEAMRFEYDALGRVVSVTDAEGRKSIYEYGPHDQVSKAIDPLGQTVAFERDVMGRLTAFTNALGARREWTYDPQKRLVRMADELKRNWVYTYDATGGLQTIEDPAGSTTRMEWTDGGRLRSIRDASGATWQRTYDALGLLKELKDPDALTTRYQYNAAGLLVRLEEPDGRARTFEYDAAGSISAINGTGGRIVAFTRNAQDQVVRAEGRNGAVSMDFDGSGRILKVTKPDSPVIFYGYDDRGLVEKLEFDGRVIQYAHNRAEQLVEIRSPESTVFIERDALGRIKSRSTSEGVREDVGYDPVGRLISLAAGSIRLSRAYDAVGNLIEERREGEQNPTRYEYDKLDQLVRVRQAAGGERVFLYDTAGNRTQENVNNKSVRRYTYSRGHRLIRIKDFLSGLTHEVEHDAAGRITALPDADGNRWQLRYDDAGTLIEAKKTSSGSLVKWQRDALMNLVGRDGSGSSERFLAADSGFLRWSQSSSGRQIDWTPQGGLDGYAARRVSASNQSQASLSVQQPDATILGHLNAAGTTAAQRLGPFGERQPAASGNNAEPLGFAGRPVCPESGIVDMRARPYAPWLGRFLTPDPFPGALSDPRQRNPYIFVGNNPLKRRDPLGLQWYNEQLHEGDTYSFEYTSDVFGDSFTLDMATEVVGEPLSDYDLALEDVMTGRTPLDFDNSLLDDIHVDPSEILDRMRDTQQQVIHEVGTDIQQSLLDAMSAIAQMIAGAAWNIAGILKEGAYQAIDLMGSYLENVTLHEYQHQMWSELGKAAEMGWGQTDFLISMGYNFITGFYTAPKRAIEAFKQGDYFNVGAELSNVYLTYHPMAVRAFNRVISALPNTPGWAQSIKASVRNAQLKALSKSVQAKYRLYGARETPAGVVYGGQYVPKPKTLPSGELNPKVLTGKYNPRTRVITVYEQAFTQSGSLVESTASTAQHYTKNTRLFWETLLKGNSAYKTLAHEWWHNIQNMTRKAWYDSNGARVVPKIPTALREVEFTLRPDQAYSSNSLAGAYNMGARMAPLQGFQAQIVLLIRELIVPDFGGQEWDPTTFQDFDDGNH